MILKNVNLYGTLTDVTVADGQFNLKYSVVGGEIYECN